MYINIKNVIDFILSFIILILVSPLFIFVIILLFISNEGKIFFTQERPGKGEKLFKIIKFKTLNDKKDNKGELLPDIKRLTKIGGIIRKFSLDELPQLINVMKGDMSLIGPRPLFKKYLPYYSKEEQNRHNIKPGITGWAQVNGRNNLDWDKRLELDVFYVKNISFIMDLRILIKTIKNILFRIDVVVIPSEKLNPLDYYRDKLQ